MDLEKVQEFKKRIEEWSGFTIHLDINSTQDEWIDEITHISDQLSNEISDKTRLFESEIKALIPDE